MKIAQLMVVIVVGILSQCTDAASTPMQKVILEEATSLSTPMQKVILEESTSTPMQKVILDEAPLKGALCLDGSPPGYYLRTGTSSPNKWIVHLQGGAWCFSPDDCLKRSQTEYGSSKDWAPTMTHSGFLSDDCSFNPDFCGWSMVYVRYCDGASYSGNVVKPFKWKGKTLYFRGFKILEAVIDSVLETGGDKIEQFILTGCSAGALGTYLHADYVRSKVPSHIPMHVFADGGYFLDVPNIKGIRIIRYVFQYVFKMQNCSGGVNQDCIAANPKEQWKCFLAQYTFPHIKTPVFLLNSQYDNFQLKEILQLDCCAPNCPPKLMEKFYGFGKQFREETEPAMNSSSSGVYIDSCILHCQSLEKLPWSHFRVDGQTIRETFYAWLTNSSNKKHKVVDCDYPCNPTCY